MNPYHPPTPQPAIAVVPSSRAVAAFRLRSALVILLVPALFNSYAFDAQALASGQLPTPATAFIRVFHLAGFFFGSAAIWFLGLPVLEAIAQLLRWVFGRAVDAAAWNAALYQALSPATPLAAAGAVLWTIWVIGFYYLGIPFMMISWLVGVPAHLLAAWMYVPLLYRWTTMART